jgi:tRNA A-37 threonylcarbamoyl transferase component Bud32
MLQGMTGGLRFQGGAASGLAPRPSEGPAPGSFSSGDLAPGATLGRYELLLPVAQGGMAQVWVARLTGSRGFSKTVAIKTMLPALSADPRFEKMFLSEAEIASRIRHPNVCEILDLGEDGGVLYLVMEWIDGESLVTLTGETERDARKLPYEVSARIVCDAALGLHAAHELADDDGALVGVVHRDVSPHNILVTYDGHVKIVDFGVAKAVARSDHQATSAGQLKGKVQFMAPEQAFCDEIDRRADVFALGIVLYQLLTGTHPFRADNELATLARITSPEPVPGAETLAPDCPPELSRIAAKAMAKDRDDRYASMSDLARDLDGAVAALAAAGHAVTPASFVREALGDKAAERAAALKGAARLAEARGGSLGGAGRKLPADMAGRAIEDGGTDAPVSVARRVAGRSVPLVVGAVGLAGVGLGLAAALLWVSSRASSPAAPSVAPASSLPAASPATAEVVTPAPVEPAPPPRAPPVPTAGTAVASASAPPPVRRPVPVKPAAADAKAKFRNPGF